MEQKRIVEQYFREMFDEAIMKEVSKQKLDGYVGYDQIKWAFGKKITEMVNNGKTHFSIKRLIKETIKEERQKGNLLPEEWD